jgi:hypothetical protein
VPPPVSTTAFMLNDALDCASASAGCAASATMTDAVRRGACERDDIVSAALRFRKR